jgi:DNA-directed RNA polymerase subunit alpha
MKKKRVTNLNTPVSDSFVDTRTLHAFQYAGIRTLADLLTKTPRDLLLIKNFGAKSVRRVQEKLSEMGLSLDLTWEPKHKG